MGDDDDKLMENNSPRWLRRLSNVRRTIPDWVLEKHSEGGKRWNATINFGSIIVRSTWKVQDEPILVYGII